jgi:hypothetical protein
MPEKTKRVANNRRARKPSKKAQLWANYHKQQDDIKRAQFFEKKKDAARSSGKKVAVQGPDKKPAARSP